MSGVLVTAEAVACILMFTSTPDPVNSLDPKMATVMVPTGDSLAIIDEPAAVATVPGEPRLASVGK